MGIFSAEGMGEEGGALLSEVPRLGPEEKGTGGTHSSGKLGGQSGVGKWAHRTRQGRPGVRCPSLFISSK